MSPEVPSIGDLKSRVDRVVGRRDSAQERFTKVRAQVQELISDVQILDLVSNLFRTLIDKEVEEGVDSTVSLLTEGLRAVFSDQDLSVRAETQIQRGKVSLSLLTEERTPGDSAVVEGESTENFGGSVTTTQSVLMRIVVVMRRGMRPLLFFDESLSAFDPQYVNNFGKFLSKLCDRLGMDLLAVTQDVELWGTADHAYRIKKVGKTANFHKIR